MMKNSLITTEQSVNRSLAVATARLNDAINSNVVALATRNGSTTTPTARYVHYANATARAVGLAKSDAQVVASLPLVDRSILALVRAGIAARIPQWTDQVEREGGVKSHNKILHIAKQWASTEAKALRGCGIKDVIAQAESVLALEHLDGEAA